MNNPENSFKFKSLTVFVLCLYLFWAFFGIDITINGEIERIPLHRVYLGLTLIIFVFNFKSVFNGYLKNKLLIVLFFYVLATSLWSSDKMETVKNFTILMSALTISIMTVLVFQNNHKSLLRILFWFCFVMVAASIATAIKFPEYGIDTTNFAKSRWIGITDHPNKLGGLVLLSVWSAINLFYLTKNVLEKFIAILSILMAAYAVVNADSMTSVVASLVCIGYTTYLFFIGNKSFLFKLSLILFASFTLIVITTFYMSSEEIVTNTLASGGRNTTLTGRSLLWKNGLESFSKNIFFGEGFDKLDNLTRKYRIVMSHLHNGYIELLVKGGIIAGILMFFVIIMTYLGQLKIKENNNEVFIFLSTGFVGILVHNFAESSLLRGLNGLGVIFILIVAYTNMTKNKLKST
jgi:exopolysaccharide production protein ExoQ